ncbi:MAG: GrpB family protein [Candidatus Sericytochromatia bacterium]
MNNNNIEERLKEVTIGQINILNSTIYLTEYNPEWAYKFEALKNNINKALGEKVIKLEHVGSTSIINMPAKPIIDLVLEVEDSSIEISYVPQLEEIGYKLKIREPNWFEHRLLKSSDNKVNLHVFSKGCKESDRMISFRDWLNKHHQDFELYKNRKLELSKKTWKYTQEYADAKSEVVLDILTRAKLINDK